MTKHPNHHEATNITCTKNIYSPYIPSVHKKNTSIAYTASSIETVLQQEPSQTTHYRTITTQIQHILNLFRTSNTKQLQILPATTHSRTTYCKSTIPAPRISSQDHTNRYQDTAHRKYLTSSQDHTNRYQDTLHHKYVIYQYYYCIHYNTTLYEVRRQKTQVIIKTFRYKNIYFIKTVHTRTV